MKSTDSKFSINLAIETPTGPLYIIADSHLHQGAIAPFLKMLSTLNDAEVIVFLGDVFKAWLALPEFQDDSHMQVLKGIRALREKNIPTVLVAGNRELLLPKTYTEEWRQYLPFTHLTHRDFYIQWGKRHYGFEHGDQVNQQDRNYLRWYALSHSLPFEWCFRAMPGALTRWIAHNTEKGMSQTNMDYKISFPEEEIQRFMEHLHPELTRFFLGHFHQDREIINPAHPVALRLVPDWFSRQSILRIDPQGTVETLTFNSNPDQT
ncbi:MAG: metallophosphoesterase [SAR324 cluster bacterium]|nr:metallophosphoesterase [SAR324 cluster bacterium]